MSREVANLTERKNPPTHIYGVKEFNLSVCLSVTNSDLNYLRTGKLEWYEFFLEYLCQKSYVLYLFFWLQGASWAGAEGQIIGSTLNGLITQMS